MPSIAQVHWHEGLFLQPHHLQAMQRQLIEQAVGERRLVFPYPYGLIDAKISADALENMLVRFDRLRVVMPSGLELSVPDNAELPALDIKQAFASGSGSFGISLAVPLWYSGRGNTIESNGKDDWRTKRIYKVSEIQSADENTGENPQPLMVRKINARLLLDDDDRTDMEVLPLIRIAHATGEDVGLPKQDPSMIPACFVLSGSPGLRDLVRDLSNQVEASRKELVIQISRGGFTVDTMRGVQFEQMLRLRTLNRFSARLPHMVMAPGITPFEIYLELRELLGELAALHPDRDQFEAAGYDHDNPAVAFNELAQKIRGLLRGTVAARFKQVQFQKQERMLVAALSDDDLNTPNEYFLGIKTREDAQALAILVENGDKFKLMARSKIALTIYGIKLKEERHPPLELPASSDLHYFRLMRAESARMWEQIKTDKSAAIRWPELENSDFAISLYMTIPGER